jgi:predicted DsbA family dithiol-disulfide isomerase
VDPYDVFFDFRCPYVYRAATLLRRTGRRPRWRYFSLTQANAESDGRPEGWTAWDAAPEEEVRGRLAFAAAEAAARQGRFEEMHRALLTARHEQEGDLENAGTIREIAAAAGLDLARFERDLADPAILEALRRDHTEGVERYRVFGTPTFVAADGSAAYVRLREVPEGAEAERAITLIEDILASRSYLAEVKRPA